MPSCRTWERSGKAALRAENAYSLVAAARGEKRTLTGFAGESIDHVAGLVRDVVAVGGDGAQDNSGPNDHRPVFASRSISPTSASDVSSRWAVGRASPATLARSVVDAPAGSAAPTARINAATRATTCDRFG